MKLLRRLMYLVRRRRMEDDLAEEMAFHRELLRRDCESPRAAGRAWGNTALAREDARGVWLAPWVESFGRDFLYGIRGLRREPGYTLVALAALAIAIGLNAGVFTVFNAIAFRPWPVKDPGRVVNIMRVIGGGPRRGQLTGFGVAEWRYLAQNSNAFSGLVLTRNGERVEVGSGAGRRSLSLTYATADYFSVLGVDMARGRGFLPEEDRPLEPEAVAVLSYATWMNRFGGDPAIVGKTLRLDDIPFIIAGVAPESFRGTDVVRADLWAPLSAWRTLRPNDAQILPFLTELANCCSHMAGRLAPGYTREQGAAEIALLTAQLRGGTEKQPADAVVTRGTAMLDTAGDNEQRVVPVMAAMSFAVTLVLLLACANVGNLLLARAAARGTEIAVRLSLGGSRMRLVRQFLVESFTLALAAAVLGLAMAWIAPSAIVAGLVPESAIRMTPDWRVTAYTAGVAMLACLAFGLAPALQATRGGIASALKREGAIVTRRLRLRGVLLAAQVSISVILLAGAGLLIRGVQRAQHQDPGFRAGGVTVASFEFPAAAYSGDRSKVFANQLRDALAGAADLPPTGIASDAPLSNQRTYTVMRRQGDPANRDMMALLHDVTAGYFDALQIPVVAGRNFTRDDTGQNVVLLNETAARGLWGNDSAVGKKIESNGKLWDVVGVVKDAYTTDFSAIDPTMYWADPGRAGLPQLLIADSRAAVTERIEGIVRQLEPKGRVVFAPLSGNLRARLEPAKYGAMLAGALGVLALALASIGMSGVFAYMVRQRTREIGVRMALGAHPAQVVRLVLVSNLRAVAWGLAVGLAGALAVTRVVKSLMNGVSPFDPVAYAGVFALLIGAAAIASALPARRAARVDPLRALRWE